MKRILLLIYVSFVMFACGQTGNDTNKTLELVDGTSSMLSIRADETQKTDVIKFKSNESWTASIKEIIVKADEKPGVIVEWLQLSAYEGSVGDVSLSLTLQPNTNDESRKAEIRISAGVATLVITVEQKGIQNDSIGFITADGKITGGEIFGESVKSGIAYEIGLIWRDNSESSAKSYPYSNKNFDITLPVPKPALQGAFNPELNTAPSDAKFSYCNLVFENGTLELTNIPIQNLGDEKYKVKQGEGYVNFIYASKASTINGTYTESYGEGVGSQTFVFNNCQFRQSWNEMVLLAVEDADEDGSLVINVTANDAASSFRWVAATNDIILPTPTPNGKLRKLNEDTIQYSMDGIFSKIGNVNYCNKNYSEREWAYVGNDNSNNWICYFVYEGGKISYTDYLSSHNSEVTVKTLYKWSGDRLISVQSNDYNEITATGMRLDIEYGNIEYSYANGNVDINCLVANDNNLGNMAFLTPAESAIGVMSIPYNKLISKIVVTDNEGGKYGAIYTYLYEFDNEWFVSNVYAHVDWPSAGVSEERLLYALGY